MLSTMLLAAALSEPLVFTQWQYYPVREQARGYLGRYPDQPLVVDSDLPEDSDRTGIPDHPGWSEYVSMADIDAMYAEGKSYGLDGFAFFPGNGCSLRWNARNSPVKGMLTQPIINFWRDSDTEADIGAIAKAVEYGCGAQVNGKALILSYWTDRFNKPAQLAEKLKKARERIGDRFVYMAATSWSDGMWDFRLTGQVAPKRMEEMKEHFREMLRVADGILLDGAMSNHAVTNRTRVYAGAYHRMMAEVARSVVDEPEFRDRKLLGFTLSIGHQNGYHQNFTANAMGTWALRESFEAAIAGRPDVILIPEWDECNESTSWKPTLYNGYSTKRLFRYYDAVLRGRKQTVMSGDDVSKPNLILSYRKALSPGEWLYFETVNVPDGLRRGRVRVSVELADAAGRVIRRLPERTLDETALDVTRWDVRSEELAELTRAVDVRLKVNGKTLTGFHPIDLAPANSWNLKDVKQPIRDLAPVVRHAFASKGTKLSAQIECDEPIRHAMLCGNGWIQYIHNPSDFRSRFREDDDHAVFTIGSTRTRMVKHDFGYAVPGVPEAEWLCWNRRGTGERFGIDWLSIDSENVYLRIPKTKLADAVLKVDYAGILQGEIRLADAHRLGTYAIGGTGGVECAVARFALQSRYPSALKANLLEFEVKPDWDRRSMMYHLQVVTMSGKTWRSEPIVAERPSEKVKTVVWSALRDEAVGCELPRSRVPRLEYDFSPDAGDVMRVKSGERHFFGMLGSFAALGTLWNRGSSLEGPLPRGSGFWQRTMNDDTHPAREKDESGAWALSFDGKDDFVSFPQETVPQWAASRIEIGFRQNSTGAERKEMLFASRYDNRSGICDIYLDKGEVVVKADISDNRQSGIGFEFRTGLKASPDAWHDLAVRATGTALEVVLDGAVASKPMELPGVFMNTAILGGAPRDCASFFTGKVRRLVIDHAVGETIGG